MPDIPRHTRRVSRTATVGQAPLPLDIADTGAQAIAQGLGQLGAGITNIGIATQRAEEDKQQQRDTSDYWQGLGEYQTALNDYDREVREGRLEPGEASYSSQVATKQSAILEGKSTEAQRRIQNYFNFHDPINIAKTNGEAFKIQQGRDLVSLETTMEAKLEAIAHSGSEKEREFLINEVHTMVDEVTPTLLSPEKAKQLKDSFDKSLARSENIAAVSDVHAMIEAKNFEAAKILAQSGDIPEPQQTTLRNAIRSAEAAALNEAEVLQQTAIDVNYEDVAKSLSQNPNSVTLSSMSETLAILPEKDRKTIEGVFNKRTAAIAAGQVDPFTIHDPGVMNIFMRTLERDAASVSTSKIFESLGSGLTPEDFSTLAQYKEIATAKDSIMNQPDVREALSLVNGISALDGRPTTRDQVLKRNDRENKWKLNILEEARKGRRDEDLIQYTENKLVADRDEYVGNWLGNWWRAHMPQSFILPSGNAGWWWDWHAKPGTRFKKPETQIELRSFTNEIADEFGEEEGRGYYDLWIGDFSGP